MDILDEEDYDDFPTIQTGPREKPAVPGVVIFPDDDPPDCDIESNELSRTRTMKSFMMEEIDLTRASIPLSMCCFMSGFIDAVSFSAVFVWCAFQTGNSVQLAISLARRFGNRHDTTYAIGDQQSLCSVLTFIFGAFLGRIGNRIGYKTRIWLTFGTFFQTMLTAGAAILIWKSHSGSISPSQDEPAWTGSLTFVALAFISASMGLQSAMGRRMNTLFATTVVITATMCELVTEPQLFDLRRFVPLRDRKLIAIIFVFCGCFAGTALLEKIGDAGTLGIGAGLRFMVTIWWLVIPAKKDKSSHETRR